MRRIDQYFFALDHVAGLWRDLALVLLMRYLVLGLVRKHLIELRRRHRRRDLIAAAYHVFRFMDNRRRHFAHGLILGWIGSWRLLSLDLDRRGGWLGTHGQALRRHTLYLRLDPCIHLLPLVESVLMD